MFTIVPSPHFDARLHADDVRIHTNNHTHTHTAIKNIARETSSSFPSSYCNRTDESESCSCCANGSSFHRYAQLLAHAMAVAKTTKQTTTSGSGATNSKDALIARTKETLERYADLDADLDASLNNNTDDDAAADLKTVIDELRALARDLKAEIARKGTEAKGTDVFEYTEERRSGENGASGTSGAGEAAGSEGDKTSEEDAEAMAAAVDEIDPREWMVPPQCIPVHANVTTYDWSKMYEHEQFDVIMMDPPWQLATANPTRGVSLGYSQLTDQDIADLPLPMLQKNGLLFVWVINAKYQWCLNQFKKWGYEFVDEIVWVKVTNSRRLAKSHGFYLQHAKEVCLVARRGDAPPGLKDKAIGSDIIFAPRRGQSQKPTEIYELIEELVPGGRYLEIFARKNNLRDYWVSVGNEVTGTGLPPEDVKAFEEKGAIPSAKYGASNR